MLRIRDWKSVFENARSREIKRLEWVSIPNRHDGGKYAELMEHERGAEHFAAWILMVQVASRCGELAERRGELRRGDGTPHNARSLFLATRCPERIFKEAIPRLLSIGWLESDEILAISQDAATIPQQATRIPQLVPTLGEGIGGDGMGLDGIGGERSPQSGRPRNPIWDCLCEVFGLKPVTKSEKTRLGKSVREFTEKEATPDEIRIRASRYQQQWPGAAFTAEALFKHWDLMGRASGRGVNGAAVNKQEIEATMRRVIDGPDDL